MNKFDEKIKELEKKYEEAYKKAIEQLNEEKFIEKLMEKRNMNYEKTKRPPKYLIVDFINKCKISYACRDYLVSPIGKKKDFPRPLKIFGMDIIDADDCVILTEEEE